MLAMCQTDTILSNKDGKQIPHALTSSCLRPCGRHSLMTILKQIKIILITWSHEARVRSASRKGV